MNILLNVFYDNIYLIMKRWEEQRRLQSHHKKIRNAKTTLKPKTRNASRISGEKLAVT